MDLDLFVLKVVPIDQATIAFCSHEGKTYKIYLNGTCMVANHGESFFKWHCVELGKDSDLYKTFSGFLRESLETGNISTKYTGDREAIILTEEDL
jgi:hypothetical protein